MSCVSFIYLGIFCNFVAGNSDNYVSSERNDSLILLVDVDTGVDDAMALALAVTSPNVSIEVITVVAGNTNLSNAYNNTLRALHVLNQTKIPVYKGADRPIDGHWDYEEVYFGADNFGNVSSKYPMGNNSAEDPNTYGYLKMMELIKNRSDCSLTLMMLAPLTNLAIALLVEPTLTQKLKAIYILGGNKCVKAQIKDPEGVDGRYDVA
ncbi:pyrimidine-specific ribonucleoside hydrolase RihA-like [Haemaphysalis longicornis]